MEKLIRFRCLVLCVWSVVSATMPVGAESFNKGVLAATGVRGGLVAGVQCSAADLNDAVGELPAVVQLLESDPERIDRCREFIESQGLGGRVSVGEWPGNFLPYADNLVNLVVCGSPERIDIGEVQRVLAPGGVFAVRGELKKVAGLESSGAGPGWHLYRKPVPEGIDEWTHWLHGADGNPVARDTVSGPPESVQWISAPRWSRSHDLGMSMTSMVTGGGRLFMIADEGPVGMWSKDHGLEQWYLICRDAFNGIELWRRPISDWGMRAWSPDDTRAIGYGPWSINPRMAHKRLVVQGDVLLVTSGFKAPVSVLDARTGETLRTLAGSGFAFEMVADDGVVYLAVDKAAAAATRYVDVPRNHVMAYDFKTGRKLWETSAFPGVEDRRTRGLAGTLSRLHVTLGGGKVYLLDASHVMTLDAATGEELWRKKRAPKVSLRNPKTSTHVVLNDWDLGSLLYSDGVLYYWMGINSPDARKMIYNIDLFAYEAGSGDLLWEKRCGAATFAGSLPPVYEARGLIWVQEAVEDAVWRTLQGLDSKSGEVKVEHDVAPVFEIGHHHRCYPNKATENHLIYSRNGLEYVNLETGKLDINRWVRGLCQYGVMPANGLLYQPADPCSCAPSVRRNGYWTFSSKSGGVPVKAAERLRSTASVQPDDGADEGGWPIYRADAMRSASIPEGIGEGLEEKWRAGFGEAITAPTVAAGKAFVVLKDSRRVAAVDAGTGEVAWKTPVEGQADTPPTIHGGHAYIGTRDGFVYCLRAADGEVCWRFNANPAHRKIMSFGVIESAWPVHGSVIVNEGVVYCFAGRSTYLDGGLFFYALDAATGKVVRERQISTADLPQEISGTVSDLLTFDGLRLLLKNTLVEAADFSVTSEPWSPLNASPKSKHIVTVGGFLDESLFDRIGWWYDGVLAKKMAIDGERLFLFEWLSQTRTWHNNRFTMGEHGYRVRAVRFAANSSPGGTAGNEKAKAKGKAKGKKKPRKLKIGARRTEDLWVTPIALRCHALLQAGDKVIIAGIPYDEEPAVFLESYAGKQGGRLVTLDAASGKVLDRLDLPAEPVWDGTAAAFGGVFVAMKDGSLICLE